MNTHEENTETLKKLQDAKPVFSESDKSSKIEEVTKEIPLAFARKFTGIACLALWAMSLIGMLTGAADMQVLVPVLLLPLAALCFFNVPVFLHKKKTFDVVVAIFTGCVLVMIALAIFAMERR
jgi:hypothetical protein